MEALKLQWISYGYGHHASQLSLAVLNQGLKYLYGVLVIYSISVALPKYSALFFYARMFKTSSWGLKLTLWAAGFFITMWVLCIGIIAVFQCKPVNKAWTPSSSGQCLDYYRWFLSATISDVIIDFLIVILPFPVIWNLKTKTSRKVILTTIFSLAYR